MKYLVQQLPEVKELGGHSCGVADLLNQVHEGPEVGPVDGGWEVPDGAQNVGHQLDSVFSYPEARPVNLLLTELELGCVLQDPVPAQHGEYSGSGDHSTRGRVVRDLVPKALNKHLT